MISNKLISFYFVLISFSSCAINNGDGNKKLDIDYRSYYPIVVEADSLYLVGEYDKSFEKLDLLFKNYEPLVFNEEIQLYIKLSVLTRNKINKKKYFKLIMRKYGYDVPRMKHDTMLMRIFNNLNFKQKQLSKFKVAHHKNSIDGLREKLVQLKKNDQKYRTGDYQSAEWRLKRDSIDDINEKELISIFETIGYPDDTTHYYDWQSDILTVLLHTNDSIRQNYFIPKVKEFVIQGKCRPQVLAAIIDQYHLYNGRKQIYNSYLGDAIQYDTITTRQLRKNIGMHPSLSINHWIFYQESKEFINSKPHIKGIYEKNIFLKKQ